MKKISVTLLADDDSADHAYEVDVLSRYKYKVTFSDGYYRKLTGGKIDPAGMVEKSFEFLLEREGPESILREFDLPTIQKYFPDYESRMKGLFGTT